MFMWRCGIGTHSLRMLFIRQVIRMKLFVCLFVFKFMDANSKLHY